MEIVQVTLESVSSVALQSKILVTLRVACNLLVTVLLIVTVRT